MKKLIVILLFFSFALTNVYSQQECPNIADYSYMPPSIKTNDYVNILFLLDYSNSMLQKAFDNNTENEELGGYFTPSVEYCLDTEFSGTTESLFGNLSSGILSAVSDNLTTEQQQQLTSISDNASASSNADSLPELFMNCDASDIGLGEILSGFVGALTELITSPIESGGVCLTANDVMAFLEPFLQMAGAVLSSGGNGFGYQMNSSRMTRSDYVTRLLTGGVVKELGKCVSEGSNSCLGMGTSEDCCNEGCIAIDIGMLLQLVVAASGVVTGGTTTAASGATTVATEGVTALTGTSLSLFLCLPGLQSEDNCTQYTNEDECTSAEDNCTWLERHAVVLADNNTAVKWSDADSFVEDKDGDGKLCNMELYYTKNDTAAEENRNNSSPYTYDADNETQGCLEGILQDIQEWDKEKEYKPKLGGIVYSSSVGEPIPLDFDYTELANAINEATVDSQSEDDVTDTDSAVKEAREILSGDDAYTFNVNGSDNIDNITVPCTKNLIFYMSDGLWYGTDDPIINFHEIWKGGEADLNNNIPGKQNIETYAFNMNLGETDDSAVNSMQNTAVFGGYRDYDNDGWPCEYSGYPNTSQTEAIHKSCYEWDGDLNGTPDNYFLYHTTDDYEALIRSIFKMAVEGALEQHYNSTAPAIARFGDNKIGLWVNAFYFPKLIHDGLSSNWRGDVQAYFLDEKNSIRENNENSSDKVNEYKLFDLADNANKGDNLITFTTGSLDDSGTEDLYSVLVLDYGDTDEDLKPDNCSPVRKSLLENQPVWSALLDQLNVNITLKYGRTIFVNDNQVPAFTELDNSGNQFDNNTFTKDLLKDIWCITNDNYLSDIISLIRNGKNGFLYGDIVNSSPVIVPPTSVNNYHNKYGDLSYYDYVNSPTVRNRLPIVITGGNDGMVHAFYMGNPKDNIVSNKMGLQIKDSNYIQADYEVGQEIWAFMPYNALPYLQWYSIEGSRYHIPKVDYTFRLVDVSIGEEGNADPGGELSADNWRTLLVGTMGFGGKSYTFNNKTFSSSIFVLDVTGTDISDSTNEGENENGETAEHYKPMFMWEKTLPDNTLIIATPAVIKYKNSGNTNGEWYVVVGTGPNNPQADNFTENPKLYFFNLKDGELEATVDIDRSAQYKAIGEVMEVDSDNNYSDDTLFFGTYDNETGSLYSADVRNGVENVVITNILSNLSDFNAPYFAKPENIFDAYGNIWVYTASGRLFSDNDMKDVDLLPNEDIAKQYIVGLKFNRDNNNHIEIEEISASNLYDATETEVKADITSVSCYCADVYLGPAEGFSCDKYGCNNNDEDGCKIVIDTVDNPTILSKEDISEEDISVEQFARQYFTDENTAIYDGWYIDLKKLADDNIYSQNENLENDNDINETSYERAYSSPSVYGGLANFVTYTPLIRPCSVAGTTRLHSLHYLTGTPSGQISFMSSDNIFESTGSVSVGDTVTISGNTVVDKAGMSLPPPTGKSMTSVEGKDGTVTTFVGSSKVTQQTPNSSSGVTSRILFKKVR